MDIKKLEKATRIFEEIKLLDQEIIKIDSFAMMVANGEIKSSLELKVKDLKKEQEESCKVKFDEDGSLVNGEGMRGIMNQMYRIQFPSYLTGITEEIKEDKSVNLFNSELSETATMQILGILLCEKQNKRAGLIKKLNAYGVTI